MLSLDGAKLKARSVKFLLIIQAKAEAKLYGQKEEKDKTGGFESR